MVLTEPPFTFFERIFPSANSVLVHGEQPILVDTGFGSQAAETETLVRATGLAPALIVNTHWHCDHVGGNAWLQQKYALPIATNRPEGMLTNARDPRTGDAVWLRQPIEAYRVDRFLDEGDELDTGGVRLRVIHTPGHTAGHISLYIPAWQTLIGGDVFHRDDIAWLNELFHGPAVIEQMLATLDRLAALPLRTIYSGHGPVITDLPTALAAARHRLRRWRGAPEKVAWHACKRVFAYALMLEDGLDAAAMTPYLLDSAWFTDYSRQIFRREPACFVAPLLEEMLRSGAAAWHSDRLIAGTPFVPPTPGWLRGPGMPPDWPPVE